MRRLEKKELDHNQSFTKLPSFIITSASLEQQLEVKTFEL